MVKDGVNEYGGRALCFCCSLFGLCRSHTAKQHSERHTKLTNKTDMELNPYLYTKISFNIQFNSFHTLTDLKTAFLQQVVSLLTVPVEMKNHSHIVSILTYSMEQSPS
jgi:hypothetical protein